MLFQIITTAANPFLCLSHEKSTTPPYSFYVVALFLFYCSQEVELTYPFIYFRVDDFDTIWKEIVLNRDDQVSAHMPITPVNWLNNYVAI